MANKNLLRGVFLLIFSLFFLVTATNYKFGTLERAGPGLFPVVVSGLLIKVALALIIQSFFIEPIKFDFSFNNIFIIVISLILFAVISQYLNMMAGIVVMVFFSSLANGEFNLKRNLIIAASLCLVAYAMHRLLGFQLPLF